MKERKGSRNHNNYYGIMTELCRSFSRKRLKQSLSVEALNVRITPWEGKYLSATRLIVFISLLSFLSSSALSLFFFSLA